MYGNIIQPISYHLFSLEDTDFTSSTKDTFFLWKGWEKGFVSLLADWTPIAGDSWIGLICMSSTEARLSNAEISCVLENVGSSDLSCDTSSNWEYRGSGSRSTISITWTLFLPLFVLFSLLVLEEIYSFAADPTDILEGFLVMSLAVGSWSE